jgi:rod shape-determining protein MreC
MGSTGYAEKTIIFRGASMKNLKKKVHFRIKLKSKHLLVIMSIFCVSCIAATFSSGVTTAPLQDAAGILIVPFENSINRISSVLKGMQDRMRDKEEILSENENLKAQIDSLTEQNNKLIQDQTEYVRLQQMYNLDQQYTEYPKIAAEIISKDPGNWYDTFVINKGSNDGIQKDMNVIADGGLVGLVEEVSSNSATVRSIIDDSSSVSAMTASTSDTCIVSGDLRLISDGKLAFSQLNTTDTVAEGEKIVTSNISDKYLRGILIGYVSEITEDSNHLTKKGYIIPVVDFQHIQEVLVIKELKQQGGE